jgi:uncharacterized MAPEG superfamily protein
MTIPLWCLLGFVLWTLVLLSGIGIARVAQVATGRATPNAFPAGVPHGSDAYWRLNRAHANCVENVPLFASVVLVATLAQVHGPTMDRFAETVLIARVGQSLAHLSSGSNLAVNVRFTCFLIQIACLVGMMWTIWQAA